MKVNYISEKTVKLENFAENIILNCYVMVALSKISLTKAQKRAKENVPPSIYSRAVHPLALETYNIKHYIFIMYIFFSKLDLQVLHSSVGSLPQTLD